MKTPATTEVRWDRLTAPELRMAARKKTVVIIPLGATEQHGPHLPTQVDWRLAYEVSLRAASQMRRPFSALVTPAIPFGMSEHHMSLGGTLTLNYAAMAAVVGCIVKSVARHGFRRIFVMNGHGGNIAALETIITELTVELKLPSGGRHLLADCASLNRQHSDPARPGTARLRGRNLDVAGAVPRDSKAAQKVIPNAADTGSVGDTRSQPRHLPLAATQHPIAAGADRRSLGRQP